MLTWHQANSYAFIAKTSTEQLFGNPLVSRPTCPNPLLHACAHWLAHYSPHVPKKARKKGKLSMEQKAMGQLTETPNHAWPRVHPKP
jgi:hypothetical protein